MQSAKKSNGGGGSESDAKQSKQLPRQPSLSPGVGRLKSVRHHQPQPHDQIETPVAHEQIPNVVYLDPFSIEWPCYVAWALVVIMGLYIALYHRFLITENCMHHLKAELLYSSVVICSATIVEAVLLYAAWIMNCTYKVFAVHCVAYFIVALHVFMALLHLVIGIICLGGTSCFQVDRGQQTDFSRVRSGMQRAALRHDVHLLGCLHLTEACLLIATGMFIGRRRMDFKLLALMHEGLLNEYTYSEYD